MKHGGMHTPTATCQRVERSGWFAPKAYGFGVVPVTWQGWLLTFVFVALLAVVPRVMPTEQTRAGIGVALTTLFVTIVWRTTDGGWRWRDRLSRYSNSHTGRIDR